MARRWSPRRIVACACGWWRPRVASTTGKDCPKCGKRPAPLTRENLTQQQAKALERANSNR